MHRINDYPIARNYAIIFNEQDNATFSHRVMIHIPIPTTQGGEIKLNPTGSPTNILPHIGLSSSTTGHTTSSIKF
jgi:hypothetical protein